MSDIKESIMFRKFASQAHSNYRNKFNFFSQIAEDAKNDPLLFIVTRSSVSASIGTAVGAAVGLRYPTTYIDPISLAAKRVPRSHMGLMGAVAGNIGGLVGGLALTTAIAYPKTRLLFAG